MSDEKIKDRRDELYQLFKLQTPDSPEATTLNKSLNALGYLEKERMNLKQQLEQKNKIIENVKVFISERDLLNESNFMETGVALLFEEILDILNKGVDE